MSDAEKVVTVSYGGNSHQSKKTEAAPKETEKPERKVEPIEGVVASQRKKTLGRRISETFTADDAQSVASHVFTEVVIPATKNLLFDVGMTAMNQALFGGRGNVGRGPVARGGGGSTVTNHTPYNRMASSARPEERSVTNRSRRAHDFEEIVFETRGMAERVLHDLLLLIEEYGTCTVADLYSLSNITETYSDTQFGWKSLHDGRVSPTRNGYFLVLPPAQALK